MSSDDDWLKRRHLEDMTIDMSEETVALLTEQKAHDIRRIRATILKLKDKIAHLEAMTGPPQYLMEEGLEMQTCTDALAGRLAKAGVRQIEYCTGKPSWRIHTERFEQYVGPEEVAKILTGER